MATKYQENSLDREFENFWSKVNCYAVINFPYDQRCEFVRNANSCVYGVNFVPYMQLLSCDFKCQNRFEEHLFVGFFMILSFELLLFMGYVANTYYSPALKVVSRMLHMNDHFAGVTIMALCNTLPDLLFQITKASDKECVYTNDVAAAMFMVMFIGGLVCYMTPFKMHPFNTVRDLLFLLFGLTLLEFELVNHDRFSYSEIFTMTVVYVIYLIINVIDLYLIKLTLKVLRRELLKLSDMTDSPEVNARIKNLTNEIIKLSKEERVKIVKRRTTHARHQNFTFMTHRPNVHERVEVKKYSSSRYRSMNEHLFKEFLYAIKPINLEDWHKASMIFRAFYVVRAPVVVLCAIYIPLVDYEQPKNGWCKLLNCIQIFLNPAVTIVMGKSLIFRDKSNLWYANIPKDCIYGLYSLAATVPLAIVVFCQSDTRSPPRYHLAFSILNLTGSVFVIFQCTAELCVIFDMVGYLYDMSHQFISATLIAAINSLGELTTVIAMALHGYEQMAYAATIGSSLFLILLHCSGVIAVKTIMGQPVTLERMTGDYGEILYVLFVISLFATLLWTSMLNFNTRRSVGVFSMSIYGLYIVYAILINKAIISPYKKDGLLYDAYTEK